MHVTKKSTLTGKIHTLEIDISPEQWRRWKSGVTIQVACPHLSADDREYLISGSTKEEWAEYFGKED